ncbi:hypothetical protein FACS1894151_01270 [Spirochaetia bacterium]|nr:hypothetical protein FACS1894151_01270 [Spirochaetia bacterium]
MIYKVSVTYKYTRKDGKGSATNSSSTYDVEGKTESAVMDRLRKTHPDCDIVIQKFEWRS